MKRRLLSLAVMAIMMAGCGSPVPSDMFLTMSVSTRDVAVATSINGKEDEFLSGDSGSMSGSRPINRLVREGENEVTFALTPIDIGEGEKLEPGFVATLEISMKGEIVDTLQPGERTLFSRELTEAETSALVAGDRVAITETFIVDRDTLKAIKEVARP